MGPSIKGDKYQVDRKDVEDLIIQITGRSSIEKSLFITQIKGELTIPLFKKDPNPKKYLLIYKLLLSYNYFKKESNNIK